MSLHSFCRSPNLSNKQKIKLNLTQDVKDNTYYSAICCSIRRLIFFVYEKIFKKKTGLLFD